MPDIIDLVNDTARATAEMKKLNQEVEAFNAAMKTPQIHEFMQQMTAFDEIKTMLSDIQSRLSVIEKSLNITT